MVVVSAQATGAEDFIEAVWQGGELFVDEDEAFKKALGGLRSKLATILRYTPQGKDYPKPEAAAAEA